MVTKIIFHIANKKTWEEALKKESYAVPSIEKEGFIHCSQHYQVIEVANFIYKGKEDLVLLAIDESKVSKIIKYEGPSWNTFPHIYGELNTDSVIQTYPFYENKNGFIFPQEALKLTVTYLSKISLGPLYKDSRHYDAMNGHTVSDINFYIEEAKSKNGTVLDLACGTGRFSIPMTKAGLKVTGIDLSQTMIELAKEKAKDQKLNIDFRLGDIRMFDLNKKFDFIFCGMNSSQHLHEEKEFRSFLQCVKNHLAPNGVFIFDLFNPNVSMLNRDPEKHYLVSEYADPDGRGMIKVWEQVLYESATQTSYFNFIYKLNDNEIFTEKFSLRNFFPLEVDSYLKNNQFYILKKYGNYNRDSFNSESMKQIFICDQ
jgi:uncharacterized protein (DUF952 family)/ubiquinone/menaquinone biosynthesis C-methylase UbiE